MENFENLILLSFPLKIIHLLLTWIIILRMTRKRRRGGVKEAVAPRAALVGAVVVEAVKAASRIRPHHRRIVCPAPAWMTPRRRRPTWAKVSMRDG